MSSIALWSLVAATTAHAQSAAPPPDEASGPATSSQEEDANAPAVAPDTPATTDDQGNVVITGTRIARQDYVSTSPIITVGQQVISQTASVNIEGTLNQLPQFVQGQNQSAIGAVASGGRA